jgi:ElaB/YqjD/DUF883 family membrane-anchored ribosome-binding protein
MSASMNTETDLALFREDLFNLKRDVADLIEHMKGGAANTVQNAADHVERRVRSLRREAEAEGERSAEALNLFVQNQPFVALTIAVGIGYVGARVLRRSDRGRSRTSPSG